MPYITNPLTGAQTFVAGPETSEASAEELKALHQRITALEARVIDIETAQATPNSPSSDDIEAQVENMRQQLEGETQ